MIPNQRISRQLRTPLSGMRQWYIIENIIGDHVPSGTHIYTVERSSIQRPVILSLSIGSFLVQAPASLSIQPLSSVIYIPTESSAEDFQGVYFQDFGKCPSIIHPLRSCLITPELSKFPVSYSSFSSVPWAILLHPLDLQRVHLPNVHVPHKVHPPLPYRSLPPRISLPLPFLSSSNLEDQIISPKLHIP